MLELMLKTMIHSIKHWIYFRFAFIAYMNATGITGRRIIMRVAILNNSIIVIMFTFDNLWFISPFDN